MNSLLMLQLNCVLLLLLGCRLTCIYNHLQQQILSVEQESWFADSAHNILYKNIIKHT
jgi:hypothetical protein